MLGCLYCTLNYRPYLTMTDYNGSHMVGKFFFPTPAWMVWKMSACDFIFKCLWVASLLDLGICVLFEENGDRQNIWGLRETTKSNLCKNTYFGFTLQLWFHENGWFKLLQGTKGMFWMHFPSYLWKTAAVCRSSELAVGFQFAVWADFLELAYQQLFTPVEKDLWTKQVELGVWSCRTVSTEGFLVPSPEKV